MKFPRLFSPFGWGRRIQFYHQVSSQIDNGRALTDVLSDYQTRLARRKGNAALVEIIGGFVRHVRDGDTLVVAMDEYITNFEKGLLTAGERVGKIGEVMRYIILTRESEARIKSTLRSSMTAPAVYIVTLVVTLWVIGVNVVPQLASVLPVDKWKGTARMMYLLGQLATGWWGVIVMGVLSVIGAIVWKTLPRWTGRYRDFCDQRIFPYTIYRETVGFGWLLAFMAMIRSGMPDEGAIAEQAKVADPWLSSQLIPIRSALRDGKNLFEALSKSKSYFPSQDIIDEVGAYVAFPDFSEKMVKVVDNYSVNFENRLKRMSTFLGAGISSITFAVMIIIQLGSNQIANQVASGISR